MTSTEIRQQFLDFFESKQHIIVPSAPIVIKDDPSLLFTNAGMNQFKDYFLGNKVPPYGRVADTQKCLRVSGKHNDLEEVGVDTYHHTMFEMLGNWSFGDYFKQEAIGFSWELLSKVYKIPTDRLYATVFEGDEKEGIPAAAIALKKWKEYLPENQIVFGNKKDNFWEMGDTGPCGPCSEIHVDCRPDAERALVPGKDLVNKDHPQVIEIWNNVFIQYNRKKDGTLEPLPATHVDTGMGFERLVRVIQHKTSNYDTDVFMPTIAATEAIVAIPYNPNTTAHVAGAAIAPHDVAEATLAWKQSVSFRVIADHIRAISFCIADGQLPSNTGAGYVIRRILRRAVRYYYSYLQYKQPLLYQLVPLLANQFATVFPELLAQYEFVGKVIKEEEEAFLRTLDKGLKKIDELINASKASGIIAGHAAFELLDTFGFPIDLTTLIAAENNIRVDEAGFDKALAEQKNRSRAATALDTEDWVMVHEGNVTFVGYDTLQATTKILRYRKVSGKGKELYQIVLQNTPFYAESGGQVGDTGTLQIANNNLATTITIIDTKKENDLIIHYADSIAPNMSGSVTAVVNEQNRQAITTHHTATHLMHAALRNVLGTHVAQKGSLVNSQTVRFDFSHFAKLTPTEIARVEEIVNQKIRANIPVIIKSMPKEEALKTGAMALFGEKYGNEVRVVIIDANYSIELCGGTHVGSTGQLGYFKITSEAAVAAGVRRIEATAGIAAANLIQQGFSDLATIKTLLKNPIDLAKSVEQLQLDNNALLKKIDALENIQIAAVQQMLMQNIEVINNINCMGKLVNVPSPDALKKLCLAISTNHSNYFIVLGTVINDKAYLAISISNELADSKQLDANKIIKNKIAALIGGGGGGNKTLATAGGKNVQSIAAIIDELMLLIK